MRTLWLATLWLAVSSLGCPPPAEPPHPLPPEPSGSTTAGTKPDRGGLPKPAAAREWAPPTVATWKLGNGMDVWHIRQSQTPLISLRLVFPNGSASDPAGKAGATGLMADMLDEGAGARDALAIGEALQRLATDYGTSPTVDAVTLHMGMLSDTLPASLDLLADMVQRPHFAKAELDRRRGLWVAQAVSREADPNDSRNIVMQRALFGPGYGGSPSYGTKSTLKGIDLALVKRQYDAIIQPEGATFVVVGDVERAAVDAELRRTFGSWTGKPSAKNAAVGESAWPAKALYRVNFPGSTQSSVAVVSRIPGATAEDYFEALVFNHSLGGSFASRLNLNLREDKGYTYGAHATLWRYRAAGVYALGAQVKRETTRASIDEMLKELRAISSDKPLAKVEHEIAIDGLMLGFPGRFESLSGIAGQLADLVEMGRPSDWLTHWPTRVRAVSLDVAAAAAKRHASQDYAVIVAGDLGGIGTTLDGLERPVYDCDPEGNCKAPPK